MDVTLTGVLAVACGSGLGGALRYLVTMAVAGTPGSLPWGTLVVNVLGCLAIGLLSGAMQRIGCMEPHLRLFLTVGVCGGFTTFSTFINEDFQLFSTGEIAMMGLYTTGSLILGFGATALGYFIAR